MRKESLYCRNKFCVVVLLLVLWFVEAEHSESKPDFVHKMAIAQKEINETLYWLELLSESKYITITEFDSINTDAVEIIKMLTSSIKTAKQSLTTNH